jgi:GH15 family glucan-1,4-alpha-glucosidase
MALPIEDYALIGDCQGAALVGRDGSIDWLCMPRFDSDACFAALLGDDDNGFWRIAPAAPVRSARRWYREGTLTVETELVTDDGVIVLIDFMAIGDPLGDVVRIVCGTAGTVAMRMELVIRSGYGLSVPWVRRTDAGLEAIAGPDRFRLTTPVAPRGEGLRTVADFSVRAGERVPFVFDWSASHVEPPLPIDAEAALAACDKHWLEWTGRSKIAGPYAASVHRSLLTLKALTYQPTGGVIAAPTTSLPEAISGVRNWDYRFCWVRDAAFSLYALLSAGYHEEAIAWRDWLLRAAAGAPSQLQVLYGIGGERRIVETELAWLKGYQGSTPVRIGNLAAQQLQLDVYGELMGTLYVCNVAGLEVSKATWALQLVIVTHLETAWREPDSGIWEVRGQRRHFTHSKVMCWFAMDCAIKSVERFGLPGPAPRWRAVRDEIHADVCSHGFDAKLGSFVQHYGSTELDASLLLLPVVGFLPPEDPRIIGTVDAIQRVLVKDGLVRRYIPQRHVEGLPEGEGAFLACSFWLADALTLLGRGDEARRLFERLLALTNDVGLLSEQYDASSDRMLGNFPQALSHVALVNTALNLSGVGPISQRRT